MLFQLDWTFGLGFTGLIVLVIAVILIALLVNTLLLFIALKLVSSSHNDFGEVFVTAIIMALIGWIPCLGCILCLVVINSRHDTGFGMAIVVYIIAGLIGLLIAFSIAIAIIGLLGFTGFAIPFI